jgi:hypothetical protein
MSVKDDEIRWIEDDSRDSRLVLYPPGHPSGLIGYLVLAGNPTPFASSVIRDLKEPCDGD